MRISIITCFFNSATKLDRYFASIAALVATDSEVELVLVDNASRDATLAELQSRSRALPCPVTVVEEKQPGLMYARCAGVTAAQGDFAVFFDDDNEPAPNFLSQLRALISRFPTAVVFTGNAVLPAEYEVNPELIDALRMLAVRKSIGEEILDMNVLAPRYFPFGAGLCVAMEETRQACRHWLALPNKIVGRTGSQPTGGEEIWLVHWLTRNQQQAVYSECLSLVHRIDLGRLTCEYLGRLSFEYGFIIPVMVLSVAEFKPSLRSPYRHQLNAAVYCAAKLVVKVGRFIWSPTASSFADAAGAIGTLYSLMLRSVSFHTTVGK